MEDNEQLWVTLLSTEYYGDSRKLVETMMSHLSEATMLDSDQFLAALERSNEIGSDCYRAAAVLLAHLWDKLLAFAGPIVEDYKHKLRSELFKDQSKRDSFQELFMFFVAQGFMPTRKPKVEASPSGLSPAEAILQSRIANLDVPPLQRVSQQLEYLGQLDSEYTKIDPNEFVLEQVFILCKKDEVLQKYQKLLRPFLGTERFWNDALNSFRVIQVFAKLLLSWMVDSANITKFVGAVQNDKTLLQSLSNFGIPGLNQFPREFIVMFLSTQVLGRLKEPIYANLFLACLPLVQVNLDVGLGNLLPPYHLVTLLKLKHKSGVAGWMSLEKTSEFGYETRFDLGNQSLKLALTRLYMNDKLDFKIVKEIPLDTAVRIYEAQSKRIHLVPPMPVSLQRLSECLQPVLKTALPANLKDHRQSRLQKLKPSKENIHQLSLLFFDDIQKFALDSCFQFTSRVVEAVLVSRIEGMTLRPEDLPCFDFSEYFDDNGEPKDPFVEVE